MSRKITDAEIARLRAVGFGADTSARGRLLAVADLLRMFTDEAEGLSAVEIARVLGALAGGPAPSENTVLADLHALAQAHPLGLEIAAPAHGENVGFRCMRQALSPDEAALLSDLARTCKFITPNQREDLCERLRAFIPEARQADVDASVYVDERESGTGSEVFEAVRAAARAINNSERLCFRYRTHLMGGGESDSDLIEENPVALIFSYGHYYLEVCHFSEEHPEGEVRFRRLDHMRCVTTPGNPVENPRRIEELRRAVVSSARELVDMMGDGVGRTLFLKVQARFARYVYDRFGHDLHFVHITDDGETGYVCVRAQLAPTLFRWLFGMCEGVELARPRNAAWVRPFYEGTGRSAPPMRELLEDYRVASEGYRESLRAALAKCN